MEAMKQRIIYTNADGGVSVVVPAPGCTLEQMKAAVPEGLDYEIVSVDDVPSDRTFRGAWFHDTTDAPQKVGVHLGKAKDICHTRRRMKRDSEMVPFDDAIAKKIPGKGNPQELENARQVIRDKHARIQTEIDSAVTENDLKAIIDREEL